MPFNQAIRRLTALLACCAALLAQLPDEARKAAATWLVKNCDEGEKGVLEAILTKYKLQLEPVFLQALDQGPDAQQIAAEQVEAARQFQMRQEALKTGKGLGLSEADLKAARAVTSQQYLAQHQADFILRDRSQAVAGLGIVDGQQGKAALRALAQDKNSPLQSSAQAALRRLEPPSGRAFRK